MTVHVLHNGCPRRGLDAARLADYFVANGCDLRPSARGVDLAVFVSCAYKRIKIDECLRAVELLSRRVGELIVAGCLPAIAPDELARCFAGRTLPTRELQSLDRLFPGFQVPFAAVGEPRTILPASAQEPARVRAFRTVRAGIRLAGAAARAPLVTARRRLGSRGFRPNPSDAAVLRVGSGCRGACTYCGIRRAVGALASKPLESCLAEYRSILDHGHRIVRVVADDVGSYGLDRGSSFSELLESIEAADPVQRARLIVEELRPESVVEHHKVLARVAGSGRIDRLWCPVQSGSPRLLELMGRYADVERLGDALRAVGSAHPDLRLHTHLLIGMPSETDEDARRTINFVTAAGFDFAYLFLFTPIPSTIAAALPDQVDGRTARHRLRLVRRGLEDRGILCWSDDA